MVGLYCKVKLVDFRVSKLYSMAMFLINLFDTID